MLHYYNILFGIIQYLNNVLMLKTVFRHKSTEFIKK